MNPQSHPYSINMTALIVSPLMAALESKFEVVLGGDINLILLMVECIDTDFSEVIIDILSVSSAALL